MTFSIIARCPQTRRLGLGIATFSIAAGGRCEGIRHGVGICKTQAYINRGNDLLALQMLEQGLSPAAVMKSLEAERSRSRVPPDRDHRPRGQCLRPYRQRPAAMGRTIRSATASWLSATCWQARK